MAKAVGLLLVLLAASSCSGGGDEGEDPGTTGTSVPDWCDAAPDSATFEDAGNDERVEMLEAFSVEAPAEVHEQVQVVVSGYEVYASYDPNDPESVEAVEVLNEPDSEFNLTLIDLDEYVTENCGAGAFGI
ncbi:MAG: hypothetical protein EDR02_01095 [Actinobacteria bacterium]|nr:MAG: hypothetical protein EDR02_01095 [Actinomycetota bacterium]RIK05577.1 MAG: hypothetical protein DCC48_09830 [Acidobacteriota bacterium]